MPITCQCPNRCEIHPKPKPELVEQLQPNQKDWKPSAPEIAAEDKLTLKTLEAESLKSQLQAHQASQRASAAFQQVEQFAQSIYEKHALRREDWQLDLTTLKFIPRPPAPTTAASK